MQCVVHEDLRHTVSLTMSTLKLVILRKLDLNATMKLCAIDFAVEVMSSLRDCLLLYLHRWRVLLTNW